MSMCVNYDQCPFLKKYNPEFDKSAALKKRVMIYCNGNLEDKCVRKKISRALGDSSYIPVNMMPEGKPVPGTRDTEWSAQVISLLEKFSVPAN
ncbi:MAG: hypothetical protein PHI15_08000 [Methanomicrobium sp.]|nr:hypothetical protein [Methanomicrobium sp.]